MRQLPHDHDYCAREHFSIASRRRRCYRHSAPPPLKPTGRLRRHHRHPQVGRSVGRSVIIYIISIFDPFARSVQSAYANSITRGSIVGSPGGIPLQVKDAARRVCHRLCSHRCQWRTIVLYCCGRDKAKDHCRPRNFDFEIISKLVLKR